jgi:hypothetical protein
MTGMTAKEALRNYIDGLSEDDAADLLLWIEDRQQLVSFSEDENARIVAGCADLDAGRIRDHVQVMVDARAINGR